ncbi:MAG: hypothetical protein JWO49_1197 [Arthrobacter sp.]|nr:hypothetical protein [Arthrobacter sp.]
MGGIWKLLARRSCVPVEWIDVKKGTAYVGSGPHKAYVGVVTPEGRSPYLRSYADKEWNNNLLSLPHF